MQNRDDGATLHSSSKEAAPLAARAEKTDPALWQKVKARVQRGDKGGGRGQWSARKAQLAVREYRKAGGGYRGGKGAGNHLLQWDREDWGTKSGRRSRDNGERYLPRQTRAALSEGEYRRSTEKKRADTRRGRQFSAQPKDVARKAAAVRSKARSGPGSQLAGLTRAELMERARSRAVPGRSRMRKDDLARALSDRR